MKRVFLRGEPEKFPWYVAALEAVGVEPVASLDLTLAADCDGLLLAGGGDVDPSCYGQENTASGNIDHDRDRDELQLIRQFMEREKPIFGICRGHQILNVALGGTLIQHIPGHGPISDEIDAVHPVRVEHPFMQKLYGDQFISNSTHHQVLDQLGTGLSVTCRSMEGYVEGTVHENGRIFSTQFHPERMSFSKRRPDADDGEPLFRTFAAML